MSSEKQSVEWKVWFATEEADTAIDRLQTAPNVKTSDVAVLGQDTVRELISIKKPGTRQLTSGPFDFPEYLDSLTLEDLQSHVSAQAKLLANAQIEWHQKRNKGYRKFRTGAQDFTVTFDRFLKPFSGVVEIAKMADEAYGGAATKIISLFYATVKIKADNDEAILTSMQTIADRLPDAKIYEQVYADGILAMMIVEAYRNVLVFAKGATEYFQGRALRRTLKSIGNPVRFPDMSEELVRNFTSIRIRAEALLSQRVAYLAVQNAELLSQVKILTDGQNADRARRMQKLLDRRHSYTKKARDDRLDESRRLLSLIAKDSPRELRQMTFLDLQGHPQYQTWAASESSLLFLHGCNYEGETALQSWLSLAAVDLIVDLQRGPVTTLVAYEMCSPQQTIQGILKSLISQLFDLQPAVLGEAEDEREIELRLSRNQESRPTAEDDEQAGLQDYAWVLHRIIDRCNSLVYLVISRPETCRGKGLWNLIQHVLDLVIATTNNVKVLMVVRRELWSIEERLSDIDKSILDSNKLVVLRQDQTEMELGY
ncbi:hypothetical protein QBC34DRAFT_409876 [Podospora aff. communis PSN243]|uniref:DUF7708 domain-containing protein n=1 Tax=Podospora aff. communis PSN243 TaxID=3040156 RepID=A0AAV9GHC7_9PEZI|nr:hypothetical protein QBC34DRAFT_409876 [Podospora aff. communis PSN243]